MGKEGGAGARQRSCRRQPLAADDAQPIGTRARVDFEILEDFDASAVLQAYRHFSLLVYRLQCIMAPEQTLEGEKSKQPKSFEALTPGLAEWILDYTHSMGFARTTPVQAMAIPLLMGNKDLVVEVRAMSTYQRKHLC